jgi:hypothetical protein
MMAHGSEAVDSKQSFLISGSEAVDSKIQSRPFP